MNLGYYDIDLWMIKLMYGDVKDNVLNTTLYLRNVSDVSYICLDSAENFYVYSMYKFKLFNYDWANLLLGVLQNSLGRVLTINKIYENKIAPAEEKNDTQTIYYNIGRIANLILDFEPVILESEGLDSDVYLQPEVGMATKNADAWKMT